MRRENTVTINDKQADLMASVFIAIAHFLNNAEVDKNVNWNEVFEILYNQGEEIGLFDKIHELAPYFN